MSANLTTVNATISPPGMTARAATNSLQPTQTRGANNLRVNQENFPTFQQASLRWVAQQKSNAGLREPQAKDKGHDPRQPSSSADANREKVAGSVNLQKQTARKLKEAQRQIEKEEMQKLKEEARAHQKEQGDDDFQPVRGRGSSKAEQAETKTKNQFQVLEEMEEEEEQNSLDPETVDKQQEDLHLGRMQSIAEGEEVRGVKPTTEKQPNLLQSGGDLSSHPTDDEMLSEAQTKKRN
ncbi:hypothetical protein R1sor_013618 [Riccia sorocarpa]|uniref:Uncharacterized protein n=1 Tax=Riccia sorocarpa TaxID=122646 RepID=A0ABD3HAX7_9MARC